jgi:hypothetical protein
MKINKKELTKLLDELRISNPQKYSKLVEANFDDLLEIGYLKQNKEI